MIFPFLHLPYLILSLWMGICRLLLLFLCLLLGKHSSSSYVWFPRTFVFHPNYLCWTVGPASRQTWRPHSLPASPRTARRAQTCPVGRDHGSSCRRPACSFHPSFFRRPPHHYPPPPHSHP
uniref:Uncharacterized protein n=1 Tax=Cacopsylla melanoneura TaxID=428564 RepID=A0A8D8S3N3_9HEMI